MTDDARARPKSCPYPLKIGEWGGLPANEGEIGEVAGERRALEAYLLFVGVAAVVMPGTIFLVAVLGVTRISVHPPSHLGCRYFVDTILRAVPIAAWNRPPLSASLLVSLCMPPSRIPQPPLNLILFVFTLILGAHPIREVL